MDVWFKEKTLFFPKEANVPALQSDFSKFFLWACGKALLSFVFH